MRSICSVNFISSSTSTENSGFVFSFIQVQALELEAQASFTGNQPSGMFYYGLTKKYDLVFGFGATVPGTKYAGGTGSELDLDLNLGLRTKLVLLGLSDVYFVFDNRDGVSRSGNYEKSDFYMQSLVISKSWVYYLADQINLGVRLPIVEVMCAQFAVIASSEVTALIAQTLE